MKHTKFYLAALLALILVLAVTTTAFADETTYKLTITNTTPGHTYEVYQIFTGDLSTNGDGKKVLTNVKYGKNYGAKGELVPETVLSGIDASSFAQTVEVTGDAIKDVQSSANSTVIDGLPAGYYLIKETTATTPAGEAYTLNILQVVGDTEIAVKADKTSSEKKVMDKNDSTGAVSGWQDSADYDIGDAVPFQLKATIAKDYDNYGSSYYLAFHDTQSSGLTFNANSVKVYVVTDSITTEIGSTKYSVTQNTGSHTFDIVFGNLKKIESVEAGSKIYVEYNSTLNSDAFIGSKGNPNEMYVEYSNNPNEEQHGSKDSTGKTPEDYVIVFTYKVVVNKVDEERKDLSGAGFTLYKKIPTPSDSASGTAGSAWTVVGVLTATSDATFEWKGIDDGEYKLVESTTPVGYNTMKDLEFSVTADHEVEWNGTGDALIDLDGGKLGTGEVSTGVISGEIENKKGIVLPSTGGVGTTLLIGFGCCLFMATMILLVTKKRMYNEG